MLQWSYEVTLKNCINMLCDLSFIEEVILAEERTTEEEKMHIMEGKCI